MRAPSVLLFTLPLCLAGMTARADVAPEPDPYQVCQGKDPGVVCTSFEGQGICVEVDCPNDPGKKCGYCDTEATATTSAGSTGATTAASTGTTAAGSSTGSSSGTAGGSSSSGDADTSGGTTTKKDDGCGCRSDASPAGALALLGLVGLLRRRRRA